MSTTNIDYQIIHYQGDTFTLTFNYTDENDNAVDLSGASAEMHIKRSPLREKLVCRVINDYPNGCFGITGEKDFGFTGGVTAGTGGIKLNDNGVTGAVFIEIDSATIAKMPAERNFYSVQLITTDEQKVLLDGTFELAREVTR